MSSKKTSPDTVEFHGAAGMVIFWLLFFGAAFGITAIGILVMSVGPFQAAQTELTSFKDATCVETSNVTTVDVLCGPKALRIACESNCMATGTAEGCIRVECSGEKCTLYQNPAGMTASPELAKRLGLEVDVG